jgi:hypothetical protein
MLAPMGMSRRSVDALAARHRHQSSEGLQKTIQTGQIYVPEQPIVSGDAPIHGSTPRIVAKVEKHVQTGHQRADAAASP